jgi:hypothetical protein
MGQRTLQASLLMGDADLGCGSSDGSETLEEL